MQKLLEDIVKAIVDKPDEVSVNVNESDNTVIYEGVLESLRHFKEDVSEVRQGKECGIGVKNYNDVKSGDQIEVYEKVEIARTL